MIGVSSFSSGPFNGRTWCTYVPSTYTGQIRVPVVLSLHGGGGTGGGGAANTPGARWRLIADAETNGMIIVYPDGLPQTGQTGEYWNDCRSDNTLIDHSTDDVGFLKAVIDQLSTEANIDRTRVYAAGISNGGLMAMRMAMEAPEQVAAITAIGANKPEDPYGECSPAGIQRTVVLWSGTADPLMPYDGGTIGGNPAQGTVKSAEGTRDYWRVVNWTGTTPIDSNYANLSSPDWDPQSGCSPAVDSTVDRHAFVGGRSYGAGEATDARVIFNPVQNGGHTVPDLFFQDLPCSISGAQNQDVNAYTQSWAVMKQYTATAPSPIFSDDFESGNLTAGGWSSTGTTLASIYAPNTGTYGGRTKGTASITKTVSTAGLSSIRLQYARRAINLDAGELQFVEWSTDGTTWNLLESHQESTYALKDIGLPTATDNQSTLMIRFRTNANAPATEVGDVDDVSITGHA